MHAAGRPARHVVENDGLLAVGCVVEFATAETCSTKVQSAEKLVVIDGLCSDVIRGCLQEEDAERVGIQRLEHDAPDRLVACVRERNSSGNAVGGLITACVCHHTDFGVRRAVCTYQEHVRRTFGQDGAKSVAEETGVVLFNGSASARIIVDGNDPAMALCDSGEGLAKSCFAGTEFANDLQGGG